MKKKELIAVILFLAISLSFSANFGSSRIQIERTWTIQNAQGNEIEFRGTLVTNNSNQRVLSITTSPQMQYKIDENGTYFLIYRGIANQSPFYLKATAIADIDFNPEIKVDPLLLLRANKESFTNLTRPNDMIRAIARQNVVPGSSLETLKNLVQWTHNYITYDIRYWGANKPAVEVFNIRRGVCVEYTHLLLSLSKVDGFKTRYVSGYVQPINWQAHAWTEVYLPEFGWVAADPTFNQIGTLDSTHFTIAYGEDQSSIFDSLTSKASNATIEVQDNLTILRTAEDPRGLEAKTNFDNGSYLIKVELKNTKPNYAFANYDIAAHTLQISEIVLLKPSETFIKQHGLNRSLYVEGYSYTIPIAVRLNDAKDNKEIVISKTEADIPQKQQVPCSSGMILVFLLIGVSVVAYSDSENSSVS